MRLAPLLLLLAAPLAHAEPGTPLTAPVVAFEKVTFENVGGTVVAKRGGIAIKIAEGELDAPPTVEARDRKLTLSIVSLCGTPRKETMTFDEISSKLDNVVAYGKHRQKKYDESKAGFAKALALDPKNRIAALNLASAQQLLGEKDAAVATLKPWLDSAPISTYGAIAQDPELAPLLAHGTLVAMKAKHAGTATVGPDGIKGAAYSASLGLLAIEHQECSWGMSNESSCMVEIAVFDAKGAQVGSMLIQNFDGADRGLSTARAKGAQLALRDLGFSTEKVVEAQRNGDSGNWTFPKLKIGIAESDTGVATILHRDTALGQGEILRHIHHATWSPSAKLVVISSARPGREGCEGTDPTLTVAVPVVLP